MKLTAEQLPSSGLRRFILDIPDVELILADATEEEQELIKDCGKSDKISDNLLGLETIALVLERREEQRKVAAVERRALTMADPFGVVREPVPLTATGAKLAAMVDSRVVAGGLLTEKDLKDWMEAIYEGRRL